LASGTGMNQQKNLSPQFNMDYTIEEFETYLKQKIDQQKAQEQMEEFVDICSAFYGKLFILQHYNLILKNSRRNGESKDYITKWQIYKQKISTSFK
jgi:hypothetical protein